jgi:hypothetical protein
MVTIPVKSSSHPLASYIDRLTAGEALLKDTPQNLIEVVGILKSYGVVLDAYSKNLIYIAENQFLVFSPSLNILMVKYLGRNYSNTGGTIALILSMLNTV